MRLKLPVYSTSLNCLDNEGRNWKTGCSRSQEEKHGGRLSCCLPWDFPISGLFNKKWHGDTVVYGCWPILQALQTCVMYFLKAFPSRGTKTLKQQPSLTFQLKSWNVCVNFLFQMKQRCHLPTNTRHNTYFSAPLVLSSPLSFNKHTKRAWHFPNDTYFYSLDCQH